ncbi:MAG: thioesterase family protein [Acidimicrobiales bacterium]
MSDPRNLPLTGRSSSLARRTLQVAVDQLVDLAGPEEAATAARLRSAAAALGAQPGDPPLPAPHPLAPAVGTTAVTDFTVGKDDTAAAMGHPDQSVTVLGSPRISLWFEVATGPLMPGPEHPARQVGVGILTHHLGTAVPGEVVSVTATTAVVVGRTVTFQCRAEVGQRLVALGVHQRMILDRKP